MKQWSGAIVTALIAVVAFSAQWGVAITKLELMEKRLDEFILEAKTLRLECADLNNRVSLLEAKAKKEPNP